MNIPLTKPFFDIQEEKAVIEVLRSGWHTQGRKVELFEKELAKFVNAKYAVAVSNCTAALYLSLLALGVGKLDEVLVPSFTFIACANVIVEAGAIPVFVEVDEKTFNVDPHLLEGKITKKTKGIIAVDQVGLPCDLDSIRKIARKYNLFIIEDAACALGSRYKGKNVGSLSDITCFSFHPRKLISTGEGGMITTNNKDYAKQIRILRSHGASVSDKSRHESSRVLFEEYKDLGFNFRLTDIQAAIGIEQLKKLRQIINKRKLLANRYNRKLSKNKSVQVPFVPSYAIHNWQSYVITLSNNTKVSQKELMQKLLNEGIATRRGVMACHLEPYYRNLLGRISLPITERLAKSTVTLPLFPDMNAKQQDYVVDSLKKMLK